MPGLIKVKTLHGACTGIPPYSNREDFLSFFNKPMNDGGFGGEASLEAMSKKLQIYLKQNSPTLVPASLEYKESDSSILARFKLLPTRKKIDQ